MNISDVVNSEKVYLSHLEKSVTIKEAMVMASESTKPEVLKDIRKGLIGKSKLVDKKKKKLVIAKLADEVSYKLEHTCKEVVQSQNTVTSDV